MLKNKSVNILKKVNGVVFPFLAGLSYFFLLMESYTYVGFLAKHAWIDSRLVLILTLISAIFLTRNKFNTWCALVFKINTFILPVSVILYLVMQFLESLHFRNYVFSIYHLQPSSFFYIVIFSFVLAMIGRLKNKYNFHQIIIILILSVIFFDGLTYIMGSAISSDIFVLTHLKYSYADKMRENWGMYYDYIKFVKANTPDDSSILVPPQGYPWFITGNIGFDRYFLYPRKLINGGEKDPGIDLNDVDYVLIDYGESTISQYGFTNIWPKFNVDGEYIVHWNPLDGTTRTIDNGKYIYKAGDNIEQWGIIRVKK